MTLFSPRYQFDRKKFPFLPLVPFLLRKHREKKAVDLEKKRTEGIIKRKRRKKKPRVRSVYMKKKIEKKKRQSASLLLDYFIDSTFSFDFFSKDVFHTIKKSKCFTHAIQETEVIPEYLLLGFFHSSSVTNEILTKYGITREKIEHFIIRKKENLTGKIYPFKKERNPFLRCKKSSLIYFNDLKEFSQTVFEEKKEKYGTFFSSLFTGTFSLQNVVTKSATIVGFCFDEYVDSANLLADSIYKYSGVEKLFEPPTMNWDVPFSDEVEEILEKSAENASERFKTPSITNEILLITLIEENKELREWVEEIVKGQSNWLIIRYQLLKHVYFIESTMRHQVPKSQKAFSYLLKREVSEKLWIEWIHENQLAFRTATFRNLLVNKILKIRTLPFVTEEMDLALSLYSFDSSDL